MGSRLLSLPLIPDVGPRWTGAMHLLQWADDSCEDVLHGDGVDDSTRDWCFRELIGDVFLYLDCIFLL